jgi:hypothetical protein
VQRTISRMLTLDDSVHHTRIARGAGGDFHRRRGQQGGSKQPPNDDSILKLPRSVFDG